MVDFIIQYWLQIVFGLILTALTAGYKHLKQQIDERVEQHKAIRKAVLALLRQYIYDSYNKWSERGYCPIYAMEVCTRVYEQYHALGGNDVGTELYERLKELPTQPQEEMEEEKE